MERVERIQGRRKEKAVLTGICFGFAHFELQISGLGIIALIARERRVLESLFARFLDFDSGLP